jgi:hypothetical protein
MKIPAGLAPSFRRISLVLAREKGHPDGDAADRYIIVAPLKSDGRIDPHLWRQYRAACRVVHDDGGETQVGHLVHGPGGQWSISYDVTGEGDDEAVFHLSDEQLRPGEYVSVIREGAAHPFRVVAVTPI